MTLLHRCRTVAVALLTAGMIVVTPASAGLMQTEPAARLGTPDAGWRALAEGTPQVAQNVAACVGCTPGIEPTEAPRRSSTLPVNVAILVLGSLWLTLMVRRIQLRLGSEDLNGGARPHAAGGH